jgi:hypothetical protein
MEVTSSKELLSRVKTSKSYEVLVEDLTEKTRTKKDLEKKNSELKREMKRLSDDVASARNTLDELMLKNSTFQEAINVAISLLRDGYTSMDLIRLKDGLNHIGIRGNPQASINRLVGGIERYNTLVELEDKKTMVEAEYIQLKGELERMKGELQSTTYLTMELLEETRKYIKNSVKEFALDQRKEFGSLIQIIKDSVRWFNNIINEQAQKSIKEINKETATIFKRLREEVAEWGEMQEKAGAFQEVFKYGHLLLGVLEAPEALKEVPEAFIAQLLDRIHIWIAITHPDATAKPSRYIHERDFNFETFRQYKLSVVAEFLKTEVGKRAMGLSEG